MERSERIRKARNALLSMERHAWEQGIAAQAFMEAGETEWVILLARDAVTRQHRDGRLGVMYGESAATDPGSLGEAVLYAWKATGEDRFKEAADRNLEYLLRTGPRTADGVPHHLTNKQEIWVDSVYMDCPFVLIAGHVEEALAHLDGYRKYLWNTEKKMYSHQWSCETNDWRRKDFWGVGNGWVAAGLARMIRALPPERAAERAKLVGCLKELLDGVLPYQRPDGFFHDVIDKPETFIETNLGQMLAYAIYNGVAGGWLERRYLARANRMADAARGKVDQWGLVQGVCGAPTFAKSGTAPEGNAFYLLMETASEKVRQ